MKETFRIAPMDRIIGLMSLGVAAIPVAMLTVGITHRVRPMQVAGLFIAAILLLIAVGLRPIAFELSDAGLRVRWLFRSLLVPRADLLSASVTDIHSFGAEFGWSMRVGAGGFLGGFGYTWTQRQGFVDLEVSRLSGMVVVRGRRRSMLLTPEDPHRFVRRLQALVQR